MFTIVKQKPQPNVYQMWFATQPKNLWITRTTWSNMCAKVVSIGELRGGAPYYGNPEVKADIYNGAGQCTQRGAVISVPGTYKTWRQISEPHWAKT
jgi:hypothetical protein